VRHELPQPYRDVEHTADVGVEVVGASAAEALARLVLAQSSLLLGGETRLAAEREERWAVAAGAPVVMAMTLLRELLFLFATRRELPAWCEVPSLDPARGGEVVMGLGRFDPARHAEGLDLKAVTWHQALLEEERDGRWKGRIIYDI
jgi:SHS2 domain-containing protein